MAREGLQGGMWIGLNSVFLHKRYIHSHSFYLSGSLHKFLNLCVLGLKNGHHNSPQPFCSCCIFVNSSFPNLWANGRLTFLGTSWYVVSVWDPQMVRDQKKFGNHWFTVRLQFVINLSNAMTQQFSHSIASTTCWGCALEQVEIFCLLPPCHLQNLNVSHYASARVGEILPASALQTSNLQTPHCFRPKPVPATENHKKVSSMLVP